MRLFFAIAIAVTAPVSQACEEDTTPVFSCQANGRKFIELCASTPVRENGTLQYRFGTLDKEEREKTVELVFPSNSGGSLRQFYGATYTHKGTYTQSIRFVSGTYSYTVFTQAQGSRDQGAGVEVRNSETGKVSIVACSERPRFYIFEFAGKLQCDPDTPVGRACIK